MQSTARVEFSEMALAALKIRFDAPLRQALLSWLTVTLRQRPWQFGAADPVELNGRFRTGIVAFGLRAKARVWYEIRDEDSVLVWSIGVIT